MASSLVSSSFASFSWRKVLNHWYLDFYNNIVYISSSYPLTPRLHTNIAILLTVPSLKLLCCYMTQDFASRTTLWPWRTWCSECRDTWGLLLSDTRMRINVVCQRSRRKDSALAGIDIIRDNWIDWKTGTANVADASDDEASRTWSFLVSATEDYSDPL